MRNRISSSVLPPAPSIRVSTISKMSAYGIGTGIDEDFSFLRGNECVGV